MRFNAQINHTKRGRGSPEKGEKGKKESVSNT